MPARFKRVPALDKCFAVLSLLAKSDQPLGISQIAKRLHLNKSTVFSTVHTLVDLRILENGPDGKFRLGSRLYTLGNAAGKRSQLIQTVHPFLESINQKTKLSAFLGIRSNSHAVILDKVDVAYDIKISSEIGMRLPLLAGAGGKALLSQLPDDEIDRILEKNELIRFTPNSIVNKKAYQKAVRQTRKDHIAIDYEEYIEGIVAFAMPLFTHRKDLQAAVWAVGLKHQVPRQSIPRTSRFLIKTADEINARFKTLSLS
jgi:IclR family KDG regulon transcriptional repressor